MVAHVSSAPSRFTREYNSGNLAVASAGGAALNHGLGVVPRLVVAELVCLTAEFNYAIGDVIVTGIFGSTAGGGRGVQVAVTATQLVYRYGLNANVFEILNKTTGASQVATNANWALRLRAFA